MLIVIVIVLAGIFAVDKTQDYNYVGYHQCSQIGYVESENVTVYPASVNMGDRVNNYILFKKGHVPSNVCAKKNW